MMGIPKRLFAVTPPTRVAAIPVEGTGGYNSYSMTQALQVVCANFVAHSYKYDFPVPCGPSMKNCLPSL